MPRAVRILFVSERSDKCDIGDHTSVRLKEFDFLPKICMITDITYDASRYVYVYYGYVVSKAEKEQ